MIRTVHHRVTVESQSNPYIVKYIASHEFDKTDYSSMMWIWVRYTFYNIYNLLPSSSFLHVSIHYSVSRHLAYLHITLDSKADDGDI